MLLAAVTPLASAFRHLASDPAVKIAPPECYPYPASVPNDPLYPDHWGHDHTAQMISYDWSTHSHTGPTAAFAGTPTSGDYPLEVQFTDQSTGSPTSWTWTFGDGGTATVQNPQHTYAAAGSYTVSLTVENADGSDLLTKTDYITVTALYSGDISGTVSGVTGTDGSVTLKTPRKATGVSEFCFEVTGATHASLTYDETANLVTKACEHSFTWDAKNSPSGMYFYRLETPNAVQTQKMVLLK